MKLSSPKIKKFHIFSQKKAFFTGVETLTQKWVTQKFKRRFQFFNLVSDFFSKRNFSKTGFNYWY